MKIGPDFTAGPRVMRVLVDKVDYDQGFAEVLLPSVNTRRRIPLAPRRGRTDIPRPGETWLIERHLGPQWTFAAIVDPAVPPPHVTGSRAASDAVSLSLLAALVELGLVEDHTTA